MSDREDIIKVNDELTVVISDDKLIMKRNGLSVSISYQEMTVIVDHLKKLISKYENIVKAQIIDIANEGKDREL